MPSSIASQRRCGFQNSKNRKVIKNISCNSTAGNFTVIKIHKNVVDAGLRNDETRVGTEMMFW